MAWYSGYAAWFGKTVAAYNPYSYLANLFKKSSTPTTGTGTQAPESTEGNPPSSTNP